MNLKISPNRLFDVLTKKKTVLAILTVLFVFPLITPSRYSMNLLAGVFIWALLAMSYDLLLGYTGLVSFGHAALFGIGAYVSVLLILPPYNIPFLPAILAAMLFGALLCLAMGVFSLRVKGIYYALVTLAFAEMIYAFFIKWVHPILLKKETLRVPVPDFVKSTSFFYFSVAISAAILIILYIAAFRDLIKKGVLARTKILYAVLMIVFLALLIYTAPQKLHFISEGSVKDKLPTNMYFFALMPLTICYLIANRIVNSPLGRIFVAIRENEERAKMLGYNVFKYKLISSSIAGIFAGLAGALYAPFLLSINPDTVLSALVTINVLLFSILGGLGTLIGPMIGAAIITIFARELSSYFVIELFGRELSLWMVALGIFYALVILFLPYGIVNTLRWKSASIRKAFKGLIKSIKISRRKQTAKEGTS